MPRNKISQIRYVRADQPIDLEQLVNEFIQEGWQPYKSSYWVEYKACFIQAMIKYEYIPKTD